MRYLFRKKQGLFLSAFCLVTLFATIIVSKNGYPIPLSITLESRIIQPSHLIGNSFPSEKYSLRFIGEMVSMSFHADDPLPKEGGSLKENSALDFIHSVPEPSTLLLVGSGLIGFALLARKKLRK